MSSPTPKGPRRAVSGMVLARCALAVGSAAIIAYGVTVFPSFRNGRGSDRADRGHSLGEPKLHPAASQPRRSPRLLAEDQSGVVNEPLLLGISVAPALDDGSLLVNGLAQGTRLSSGVPFSEAGWELPLHNLPAYTCTRLRSSSAS